MKFTQITNEFCGARNAGYVVDFDFHVEYDDAVFGRLRQRNGESWVENFKDSFHDYEGNLFLGDDGNYYHVALDYSSKTPYPPVMWRRLKKAERTDA